MAEVGEFEASREKLLDYARRCYKTMDEQTHTKVQAMKKTHKLLPISYRFRNWAVLLEKEEEEEEEDEVESESFDSISLFSWLTQKKTHPKKTLVRLWKVNWPEMWFIYLFIYLLLHMIWLLVSVTSVSEYLMFKFGLFKKNWKDQKWEI